MVNGQGRLTLGLPFIVRDRHITFSITYIASKHWLDRGPYPLQGQSRPLFIPWIPWITDSRPRYIDSVKYIPFYDRFLPTVRAGYGLTFSRGSYSRKTPLPRCRGVQLVTALYGRASNMLHARCVGCIVLFLLFSDGHTYFCHAYHLSF